MWASTWLILRPVLSAEVAEELSHYKNQFIDKVVLCNCDDPFESNFCYYFLRHFNQLKLKKLICTSYSGSKIDQLVNGQLTLDLLDADGNPVINNKHGYVLTITQIPGALKRYDIINDMATGVDIQIPR